MKNPQIRRVLISVTDKTGVVDFARALSGEFGAQIISTGGTARTLSEAGVPVTSIEDVTGFPEMMDGRVKTLHPSVHGGLLARRDNPQHLNDAANQGIEMIDMIVVNLYAFEKTVAQGADFAECIEHIDIGGPSMLRSAAKNFESVTVVTNPSSYKHILAEMRETGGTTTLATRFALAREAFRLTGAYDTAITDWLTNQMPENVDSSKFLSAAWVETEGIEASQTGSEVAAGEMSAREVATGGDVVYEEEWPQQLNLSYSRVQILRYGENPHQAAAFYRLPDAPSHSLAHAEQLGGKPLSYNNLLDADACWTIVCGLNETAVVILKHQNPCGSACADTVGEAFERAFACDEKSAYGGIIAANRMVTADMVARINAHKLFMEVLIAPDYEPAALELLQQKKNLRILRTGGTDVFDVTRPELRSIDGGLLVQTIDTVSEDPATFTIPTKRKPTAAELDDLLFAWKVCKGVKSNAILVAKNKAGIGMGPGQPNRVDSARIACQRAGVACKGAVAASDAFFPFRDGVDTLAEQGITAIIQPGGSIHDDEAIQAADEAGITMVFTGHRHFRH